MTSAWLAPHLLSYWAAIILLDFLGRSYVLWVRMSAVKSVRFNWCFLNTSWSTNSKKLSHITFRTCNTIWCLESVAIDCCAYRFSYIQNIHEFLPHTEYLIIVWSNSFREAFLFLFNDPTKERNILMFGFCSCSYFTTIEISALATNWTLHEAEKRLHHIYRRN